MPSSACSRLGRTCSSTHALRLPPRGERIGVRGDFSRPTSAHQYPKGEPPGDEQEHEDPEDKLRHGGARAAFLKAALVATAVHRHGGAISVRSELLLEHLFPPHDVWRGHRDRADRSRPRARCLARSTRPGRSRGRCDLRPNGAVGAAEGPSCAAGLRFASVTGAVANCGPAALRRPRRGTGRATCGPFSRRPGTGPRWLRWSSADRARRRPSAVDLPGSTARSGVAS